MRALILAAPLLALGACDFVFRLDHVGPDARGGGVHDVRIEDAAVTADALQWGPWSTPSVLANVNLGNNEDPSMTSDSLTLYFSSDRDGSGFRVYRAKRTSVMEPFNDVMLVPELAAETVSFGAVSGDDLEFYFNRDTGSGDDIWVMSRDTISEVFSNPRLVPTLSTGSVDFNPEVSSNGLFATVTQIVVGDDRSLSLYARSNPNAVWEPAGGLGAVQTAFWESGGTIASDGCTIVFHTDRETNGGASDIYISTRPTLTASFPPATSIAEFNTVDGHETDPFLSSDQRTLLWADAQRRIVSATRQPL